GVAPARAAARARRDGPEDPQVRSISPMELRAEGVVELGRVGSALFVLTEERLHVFHVSGIPPRKLDAWGIERALDRLRQGQVFISELSCELDIDERYLREDLYAA